MVYIKRKACFKLQITDRRARPPRARRARRASIIVRTFRSADVACRAPLYYYEIEGEFFFFKCAKIHHKIIF